MRTIADAVERIERTLGRENRADSDWDESKHKRGKDGKFGSGGGSGGGPSKKATTWSSGDIVARRNSFSENEAKAYAKSAHKDGWTKEKVLSELKDYNTSPLGIKRIMAAFEDELAQNSDKKPAGGSGGEAPKNKGSGSLYAGNPELKKLTKAHDIAKQLRKRGVPEEDIENVISRQLGEDTLNVFKKVGSPKQ
jgi:hypothetical protein